MLHNVSPGTTVWVTVAGWAADTGADGMTAEVVWARSRTTGTGFAGGPVRAVWAPRS